MSASENKKNPEKKESGAKRVYDWIKSIFKSTSDDNVKDPTKAEERDKLKELTERIDQSGNPLKVSSIPEELRADFHVHIRNMAIAGFNDGVVGLKSETHLKIAAEKADEFYREFSAHSNGKLEAIQNEIVSKKKVVDSKLQQATLHHGYQNYLQHYYKFNERGNTVAEFLLYFILFIAIFLADIPLAVETIKRIYPTYMDSKPFSFSHIGQNWEALLTAIGVASSSIYIKIWYDEFVGKKYGHAVISRKKFIELFADNNNNLSELTEAEKERIEKNEMYIKIIKSIILFFTLSVIVVIGIFRKYAWMKSQRIIDHIPYDILSLAFIFLTLLFSIISGICLSIALNTWTNYNRLRRCRIENSELERDYLKESKELASLQGEHAKLTTSVSQWGDREAWVKKVRELLSAYYEMGYSEGLSDPAYFMKHLDFFGRVLLWRETFISRKINKDVSLLNH